VDADTDFWDALNHWRSHAKKDSLPAMEFPLDDMLPGVHRRMTEVKAPKMDCAVATAHYVLAPSAPSHSARMAFALKCLARVLTTPIQVDQHGYVIKDAHDGWDDVEEMLSTACLACA